jgi:NhaA family Na+:H+ antiporter
MPSDDLNEKNTLSGNVVDTVIDYVMFKPVKVAREFFQVSGAGGIVLVLAAILALIVANTPLYDSYSFILEKVKFRIGFSDADGLLDFKLEKSVLLWVNDGLMAIFFFLVGLEIKREFLSGELSSVKRVTLPAVAAVGGIVFPALLFYAFTMDDPIASRGWAIPAATDIAFALGVISLLGSRVPHSVKLLLTAIAIFDDIAAILIIAVFYTNSIYMAPLYFAAFILVILFILNRRNVCSFAPYILLGILLWGAILDSGVHATIAGVLTALFIPMKSSKKEGNKPLITLEHMLHPWVAFCVLPIFAFANAGVSFSGMGLSDVMNPVSLGIVAGLVVGKQFGIFSALWLLTVTGFVRKPVGVNYVQLYAVSVLCGIGFTMSLFVGSLSYDDATYQVYVRIGVFIASVFSAVFGYLLLYFFSKKKPLEVSGG